LESKVFELFLPSILRYISFFCHHLHILLNSIAHAYYTFCPKVSNWGSLGLEQVLADWSGSVMAHWQ
jgi:hypothetical protein